MNIIIGAAIGFALTLVLYYFFGFGMKTGGSRGDAFALAFRFVVEAVLAVVFVGALIATAVIGGATAWHIFGGYAAVRLLALALEAANSH